MSQPYLIKRRPCQAVKMIDYRPRIVRYRDHRPLEFLMVTVLLFVAFCLFIVAADSVTAALQAARG